MHACRLLHTLATHTPTHADCSAGPPTVYYLDSGSVPTPWVRWFPHLLFLLDGLVRVPHTGGTTPCPNILPIGYPLTPAQPLPTCHTVAQFITTVLLGYPPWFPLPHTLFVGLHTLPLLFVPHSLVIQFRQVSWDHPTPSLIYFFQFPYNHFIPDICQVPLWFGWILLLHLRIPDSSHALYIYLCLAHPTDTPPPHPHCRLNSTPRTLVRVGYTWDYI